MYISTYPPTLPWQWPLIATPHETILFILSSRQPPHVFIPSESEMALQSCRTDGWCLRSVHLQFSNATWRLWLGRIMFKMFFFQPSPPLQRLPWEVSYVYESACCWTWFYFLPFRCHVIALWICRTKWFEHGGHGVMGRSTVIVFPHCVGV